VAPPAVSRSTQSGLISTRIICKFFHIDAAFLWC
jgi:hypothetical protein